MIFAALALAVADSDYLVVLEKRLEKTGYERAARALVERHHGGLAMWDDDFDHLEALLLAQKPRWLALVLDPSSIDANLPRRLVPILTRFDDDPFVDCSFGIITGATGEDCERFVANIARAEGGELPLRKVEAVSVSLDRCMRIGSDTKPGPEGRALATTSLWITGRDEHWKEFLTANRKSMEGAGLLEWGHCGDSQGIWLFSANRNREHEKHWPYDPARVGCDPGGELPRLTPALLLGDLSADGVRLGGAVVVNGSCHSGVTARTIVGPDIVSTFGDTHGLVRFFDVEPAQSFALQAIAHGASAYIAPLAANNANRAALDEWRIRAGGIALGEVMRASYDELVMGAEHLPLAFALYADGVPEPPASKDPPMFADCVHRVLFGDPAFTPWPKPVESSHRVKTETKDGVLTVDVTYAEAAHDPWIWDPWVETKPREEQGRIYEIVALAAKPSGEPRVTVISAESIRGGESRPLALTARALLEIDPDGKPLLHLKASGKRSEMSPIDPKQHPDSLHARFEVRFGDARAR